MAPQILVVCIACVPLSAFSSRATCAASLVSLVPSALCRSRPLRSRESLWERRIRRSPVHRNLHLSTPPSFKQSTN
ncbi:hypothetical protein B0H19DRAFT_1104405 [Mycena capillaripes]|nr:hypothetical protein B0H19DRAFT_1104405 [Mycena capillaripes]